MQQVLKVVAKRRDFSLQDCDRFNHEQPVLTNFEKRLNFGSFQE